MKASAGGGRDQDGIEVFDAEMGQRRAAKSGAGPQLLGETVTEQGGGQSDELGHPCPPAAELRGGWIKTGHCFLSMRTINFLELLRIGAPAR